MCKSIIHSEHGRTPHLHRDAQRGIDGQVQPGLEEAILEFHSFTLWCQVCEWITGKPRTIPEKGEVPSSSLQTLACSFRSRWSAEAHLLICPMAVLMVTRGPPSSDRRTYGGMMQSSSNTCSISNSLTSTDLEHLFLRICSKVN